MAQPALMKRGDLLPQHVQPGRQVGMRIADAALLVEGIAEAALREDGDRLGIGLHQAIRPPFRIEGGRQPNGCPRAVEIEEQLPI
jgi:hypothetical protein